MAIATRATSDSTSTARRRRARSRALTLLRRAHLYSGLFLLPWVLLYGVSALLFNHPTWSSNRSFEDLSPARIGFPVEAVLAPERLAEQGVERLGGEPDVPALSGLRGAHWSGALYYRGNLEDLEGRALEDVVVRVDLEGRGARAWRRPLARTEASATIPLPDLTLGRDDLATLGGRLGEALAPNSEAPLALDLRAAPTLHFEADLDGRAHAIGYDLRRGSLSAAPVGRGEGLSAERLGRIAKDLHTDHGYLPWSGAETAWAVFVDLMAASMLLWGLSGLVMWWQLKRLRTAGALALAASVGSALALVAALWSDLG